MPVLGIVEESDSPYSGDKPLPFSPAYVRQCIADAPLLLRQRDALLEAAKMVLQRWTFNENQWHTHTWHDMADCATVLRAAIAACERNENA